MKIFDKKRITDKIEYKDFLCYDYLILNIDLAPVLCYNKPHGVNKNLACKPFTPERTLKHKSGLASGRLCRLQDFALDLCYNKRRKSYCVSLCGTGFCNYVRNERSLETTAERFYGTDTVACIKKYADKLPKPVFSISACPVIGRGKGHCAAVRQSVETDCKCGVRRLKRRGTPCLQL